MTVRDAVDRLLCRLDPMLGAWTSKPRSQRSSLRTWVRINAVFVASACARLPICPLCQANRAGGQAHTRLCQQGAYEQARAEAWGFEDSAARKDR
jgi:hypothetical protein